MKAPRYTQKPRAMLAYLPALTIGAAFTALSVVLISLGAVASSPGEYAALIMGLVAGAMAQGLAVIGVLDLWPSKG